MPNRILRESITTSATIDGLTAEAECLFYRLLVVADDFGLFDARPAIVASRCYPLRTDPDHRQYLSTGTVSLLLDRLVAANLIRLYESKGVQFLAINQWDQHQRLRAKRSRYPMPPDHVDNLRSFDSKSTAHVSNPRLARAPVTPAESESESESESKTCRTATPKKPALAVARKPRKPKPTTKDATLPELPPSAKAWEAYRTAYAKRYGTDPVRNATVNAQMVQLVKRLGAEAADVAGYYLTSAEPFYLTKMHAVGMLLSDCEKLRTEWKTGRTAMAERANHSQPPAPPWWMTESGVRKRAAQLGVAARPGEGSKEFIERLREAGK